MPRGGSKPGERRGGRQAGTPNKLTAVMKATLRETAAQYTEEAFNALLQIMRDPRASANARTRCAEIIFDRAYGKATQSIEHAGKDGVPIEHGVRFIIEGRHPTDEG
jgi:uncharacterized phage protein gp47/JayE